MISYTIEKGKRTYQCTHPEKILEEIKNKEKNLMELKDSIPQVTELFNSSKAEIRAEVFRGNDSIKALLDESLNYKEQYWIGGNSELENTQLKTWFKHWMTRRTEKKIWLYDLLDYGTYLEGLEPNKLQKHKKNYYKRYELPKNLSSPMVIFIFGDKVAQILWRDQPFAFVLESKQIRESFMKYFNYFWKFDKK